MTPQAIPKKQTPDLLPKLNEALDRIANSHYGLHPTLASDIAIAQGVAKALPEAIQADIDYQCRINAIQDEYLHAGHWDIEDYEAIARLNHINEEPIFVHQVLQEYIEQYGDPNE